MAVNPTKFPTQPCGCGCGEIIPSVHRDGSPRQYKNSSHSSKAQAARARGLLPPKEPVESHACACGCGEMVQPSRKYFSQSCARRARWGEQRASYRFTAGEVLRQAREAIEAHGWCQQYMLLAASNDEHPQMCLLGSVVQVMSGFLIAPDGYMTIVRTEERFKSHGEVGVIRPRPNYKGSGDGALGFIRRLDGNRRKVYHQCLRALQQVTGYHDLQDWNDVSYRTVDEVLDTLSQAAELVDA